MGGRQPCSAAWGLRCKILTVKEETFVQLDLFDYEKQPKRENLNRIMDGLRDKFGENAILTAGMMGDNPSTLIRNHKARGTSLQMDHLRNNPLHKEEEK